MGFLMKNDKVKGFSLIEVLVTSLIATIVMSGITMFLVTGMKLSDQCWELAKIQNTYQSMRANLVNGIRESSNGVVSNEGKDLLMRKKNISGLDVPYEQYRILEDGHINDITTYSLEKKRNISGAQWQKITTDYIKLYIPTGTSPFQSTLATGDILITANLNFLSIKDPENSKINFNYTINCYNLN